MNESTERPAVSPGGGEVLDLNIIILSGPALTPDQDRLHLGRQALLPCDAEFDGQPSVGGHTSTFAARIESGCWVFHLLDEPRHVFQEEIVEMLLLHVLELEDGFVVTAGHG